jgi:hypothetical protein
VEADSARTPGGHPQSAAHTAPASESEAPKTIIARFVSAPADAEVEIDGEYWGNTPTAESTRLQAGPHTIVVKKLGYEPWERKVTLVAGDNRTVSAELQPIANDAAKPGAPASVAIAAAAHENEIPKATVVRFTSTPASAEVSVDGEYWGTTPTADLSRFSPGSHTILVRKVGYEPWERKVTLAAGDDRTISAELKPNDASKPRISGLD